MACWFKSLWRRSLLPLPQFDLRPNYREGTQPHPSAENWFKDLLSIALPIRARLSLPPQPVHPIRKLPQASYLYPSEARQIENHNHRKLTKWITALSSGKKKNYEQCRVGPPKMEGSRWRVLTKRGPLEKGMANHFSILALRAPWTVWKGKKIGHWKMNSPGQ